MKNKERRKINSTYQKLKKTRNKYLNRETEKYLKFNLEFNGAIKTQKQIQKGGKIRKQYFPYKVKSNINTLL